MTRFKWIFLSYFSLGVCFFSHYYMGFAKEIFIIPFIVGGISIFDFIFNDGLRC